MSRRAVVIDTQQEAPRPEPRLEPSWWKYVPGIFLRRARTTRTTEHKARVDAWEAAGRKVAVRYYIPNADIAPTEEGFTVTARAFDYDPATTEFYFPREAE